MKQPFNRVFTIAILLAASIIAISGGVNAQTATCNNLSEKGKALSRELFATMHPYDGCDKTFEKCLAQQPPKPVVLRLAEDVCRHIKEGKTHEQIGQSLGKRAQSMLAVGKPAAFALDPATLAGDPQASVVAVVYACARCPFCKVIVPALYEAVTNGPLKGKVRLYFRPFPLKDHAGSTEGGLAMLSAGRLGKFWPYLLHLYKNYDSFCPQLFPDWAAWVGLDKAAFDKEYAKNETRSVLIASKQEGIRNKVNATPSLFINGRKYVYEINAKVITDVLLEEYDRGAWLRK
jgi:protein-disulfide isomerase